MGSIFAGLIAEGGGDVTLYDINQEKIAVINRMGICIRNEQGRERFIPVPAVEDIEQAPVPDFVIVLIKSYHTEQAAREIAAIRGTETQVLTLQNGLGNVEQLMRHIPEQYLYAGITYMGGTELAPGHVYHTGAGLTLIAPLLEQNMPAAMEKARYFNDLGISMGATNELKALQWKKLIINSAINPLSALFGQVNGLLPKNPDAVRDMASLVVEGVAVAQKVGVPLHYGEMWAAVLDTCKKTANNRSSMLADVEAGRPTEVEAINGSIIRLGEANGVDTPTHNRMLRSVLALELQRRQG